MTPEQAAKLYPGQQLTIALPVTVRVVGFNGAHVWFETQSAPVHKLALLAEHIEVIETPETANPHLDPVQYRMRLDEMAHGPTVRELYELMPPPERTCEATRYAPGPCEGPARFDIVYRVGQPRREHDRHPACFRHGLAEVDRHHASGAISEIDMVEAP